MISSFASPQAGSTFARAVVIACIALVSVTGATTTQARDALLKTYIEKPDDSFRFKLESTEVDGMSTLHTLRLTSQTWRDIAWEHRLSVWVPENPQHPDTVVLILSGRSNAAIEHPPDSPSLDHQIAPYVANQIGAIVAVLEQVPNQPIMGGLFEDDLMAHTFDQFLRTGEGDWPLVFPMVKSAVRGMDTLQAFLQEKQQITPDSFILTGVSKRARVSWLTAAVDDRVKAIAPIVFDFLNFQPQLDHQLDSFGTFSAALKGHKDLIKVRHTERGGRLGRAIDPFTYIDSFDIPKLLLFGTNDPYWTVDAARFYFEELPGPKYLYYEANAGHFLSFAAIAPVLDRFIAGVLQDRPIPAIDWKLTPEGSLLVRWEGRDYSEVILWETSAPTRDFRNARWFPTPVHDVADNSALVTLDSPAEGYAARYVEVRFSNEAGGPDFGICTRVFVSGHDLEMEYNLPGGTYSGFKVTADGFPIFGSQLFQGAFRDQSFKGFNPNSQVMIGDNIQIMLWGALDDVLNLTVDAQGKVFIPEVGPISLLGVRNADLTNFVTQSLRTVYTQDLGVYVNPRSQQPVKVFVGGHVLNPGLFEGFASDSVLYFLDRAGGIDPQRGSYLNVSVLRSEEEIAEINLYEFLVDGILPITRLRDRDVVLVGPRMNTALVYGDVNNPAQFEFSEDNVPLDQLIALASPKGKATDVTIRRARDGMASAAIFSLEENAALQAGPDDRIEVVSRNVPETILASIEGEHKGPLQIALPKGALLTDAIEKIIPTAQSDLNSLQLFRESVARRQRTLLLQSLENLERAVLNARSASLEEAQLRLAESEMILAFIERARQVTPKGQVLFKGPEDAQRLHLEDGDILFVPAKTVLVTVHGEVNFPNTQTFREREQLMAYIHRAGGFTPNANRAELLVIRTNGAIDTVGRGHRVRLNPGDEIIVLPEPDRKNLQFAAEISTILYQIAITTRVAVGL